MDPCRCARVFPSKPENGFGATISKPRDYIQIGVPLDEKNFIPNKYEISIP